MLIATLMMPLMASVRSARAAAPSGQEIAEGLTCQCGCGLTVANCNMPTCSFSVPTRAEIDQLIGKGMGRAQIIAFYRHKYGEKGLSGPSTQGYNRPARSGPVTPESGARGCDR